MEKMNVMKYNRITGIAVILLVSVTITDSISAGTPTANWWSWMPGRKKVFDLAQKTSSHWSSLSPTYKNAIAGTVLAAVGTAAVYQAYQWWQTQQKLVSYILQEQLPPLIASNNAEDNEKAKTLIEDNLKKAEDDPNVANEITNGNLWGEALATAAANNKDDLIELLLPKVDLDDKKLFGKYFDLSEKPPLLKSTSEVSPFLKAVNLLAEKNLLRAEKEEEYPTDGIQILLSKNPKPDVNTQNEVGDTPLILAAASQSPQLVAILLKAGANPNIANTNGNTPLIMTREKEIADQLVNHNANVNHANKQGITPLISAVITVGLQDDIDLLKTLVDAGADVNARCMLNYTALWHAKHWNADSGFFNRYFLPITHSSAIEFLQNKGGIE